MVLPADPAAAADLLAGEVRRALDGGTAIAPVTDSVAARGIPATVPAQVAVVLSTSGSSGAPKRTMLSGAALRASCAATAHRLGGDGDWLLCLPAGFVAGFQVIARAALGGTTVFTLDGGKFDPAGFAAAVERMGTGRRYTSLVPTQVKRLLEDSDGRKALARMDRVLVGGAALDRNLADRLRELTTAVTTYGMTETCGGCVYDGVPLDGVAVRIVDGLIHLGGPSIAEGYLGAAPEEAARFYAADGRRWYATADRGQFTDGLITPTGRVDDLINTGGVKVSAVAIEAVLAELDWIDSAVVLGLPDPEWGELVSACVVPRPGGAAVDAEPLRELIRARLGRAAVPKRVVVLDELPLLPNSKIDRLAIRELLLTGAGKD
ncbi:AMP-binding protein [Nocardia yamanashiensis]|uniref:AMP-binding protein n=1 Tax=Nocardia yamanashiensis TaxID=209247 RepID=UPI001E44C139|nr:AMP-binding protein [Nocardia yamanashiensis]UGT38483.1 AMP-binding protein [Nocardia yamanashiensis]